MARVAATGGKLPPLPSLKEIIQLYNLRARKQLSQNFLMDGNLTNKIVRTAGKMKDAYVCEVGPGPGGITRSILRRDIRGLAVVEKDSRFMPGLEMLNEACGGKMQIHNADIMNFDMTNLFPDDYASDWDGLPPNIHIIGNLPFSVSTPLIITFLHAMSERRGAWRYGRVPLTLTFQKEVAERMVAEIRNRQRSRLSVMCQHLCDVKHKFTIPGSCFVPKPEVDVGVVNFTPLVTPHIDAPFKLVEKVCRNVFHFRQKKCKRGIHTLVPPDRTDLVHRILQEAEVSPDTRPYQLTMEEFSSLCLVYKVICDENPGLYEYDSRTPESSRERRTSKSLLDF